MAELSATSRSARTGGQLEPNAIGVTEDTIIGTASSAPAASVGLTLAALAAATAYGSGPIIIVIAVIGIKLTARTQIGMALVEYAILIVFAIIGLVFVLGHHHGARPITSGWASPTGVGGKGSATAGFLIAVFMFTGWDGAIYVNEETQRRRINPGRAVLIAVAASWSRPGSLWTWPAGGCCRPRWA